MQRGGTFYVNDNVIATNNVTVSAGGILTGCGRIGTTVSSSPKLTPTGCGNIVIELH